MSDVAWSFTAIIVFTLALTAVLTMFNLIAPHVISYDLRDDALRILVLRVPVITVERESITEVRVVDWRQAFVFAVLHPLTIRIFNKVPREAVLIRRDKRLFAWILITPPQCRAFAESLLSR